MTDDDAFELSRRKALAGIGTIGVASAGAGLGTSAFFSDTEDFDGNTLVAGTLDLKVDWQEHYSDWSDDEGTRGTNVWMPGDSGIPGGAVPKPTPEEPMLYIAPGHVGDFEVATAIEAFPDVDDDGVQDINDPDGTWTADGTDYDICTYSPTGNGIGADTPDVLSDQFRTDSRPDGLGGASPAGNPQVTAPGDALVQIADVKPGDFGELTLSAHLCGNDGYLWFTGDLVRDIDNVNTEPEIRDIDEPQGVFGTNNIGAGTPGELARELRAALWYDSGAGGYGNFDPAEGDNIKQDVEDYIVAPTSLQGLLAALGGQPGIPLGPGGSGGVVQQCSPAASASDGTEIPDGTTLGPASQRVSGVAFSSTLNHIDLGNGFPQYRLVGAPFAPFPGSALGDYYGFCEISATFSNGDTVNYADLDECEGSTIFPQVDRGTLTDLTIRLCYNEEQPVTDCFTASDQYYFGFAWWLPVDHANEIQGDLIEFDLGFYAEQCRHNDGSGMPPEGSV